MDSLRKKYCPECKGITCVRDHLPTRQIRDGHRKVLAACTKCGLTKRIMVRYDKDGVAEDLICASCRGVERKKARGTCSICGKDSVIKLHRDDGSPIGECCYHGPVENCYLCKLPRIVEFRLEGKYPICYKCYIKNHVTKLACFDCGKERPVAKWVEDKPTCYYCYMQKHAARHACVDCGALKPVAKWLDGRGGNRPFCNKCYQRRMKKNKKEQSLRA